MGQRSRSQHRFSLYGGITRIRGEALLLLKGNQRIVVINAPWYLLSSEPVSLPTSCKWPDRTSVVPPRCPEVPLGKVWYR